MRQEGAHLIHDVIDRFIDEQVAILAEFSTFNAGADRENGPVGSRDPAFGQAEGEDEHVESLKHASNGSEVLLPIETHFPFGDEAARLCRGSERIEKDVVRHLPTVFARLEVAVGPLEKL